MRTIIIGAGVVGYTIAKKLSSEGQDVVLIEKDEKRIREVKESLDARIIHGSGSSPSVLMDAGIEKVDMVIAVTDSDEVNMIACLIAGTQSKVPKKIARIRDPEYASYTRIFEQDYLDLDLNINPEKIAAEQILKIVEVPGAIEVEEFVKGRLKLVGCRLRKGCNVIGKALRDLKELHPEENILIVAIYRGAETIIPKGNAVLREGDLVFAMTLPDETHKLLKILGAGQRKANRVFIVGGGDVGYYLARNMEDRGYQVKVIEKDEKRCEFLAENLTKTIVINGDGTDQNLLREESVFDTDTFIAVTNDEEANILTSLLAKRLGVERCIALIDKPEYISMVPTIGIDVAVSPRLSSVSGILQFVRRGKIVSVTTLMEERVEAMETIAMETSDIVERPIKEVRFPNGAIVGAVVRDDEMVIMPVGETIIRPGDKVVIFALRETIPKVEKILMVKPEYF